MSSASIDVVTRATQGIEELRHEASVGATLLADRAGTLGLTYGYGHEPDYQTHALTVVGGRDIDRARLLHASGRLQVAASRVGAVGDPRFERHLGVYVASGSLARIVDEKTVLRAAVELSHAHGFQSSAYRTVRLGDWSAMPYTGTDPEAGAWVFTNVTGTAVERHPGDRFRAKIALDGARAFARRASVIASVAGYLDTWRVAAGDFGAELRCEPRAGLLLRLGGRAYVQSSSYFYRRRYASADRQYLTDDKELGRLRNYSLLAAAAFPIGRVRVDLRLEGTRYNYPEFTLLPEKLALAVQLGLLWRL
ncbi:MAG: DUF3570 domain-containing protein [Polyangiaceae bacterium]|nr:DUF3570 domain-containing protein [Polyangiaceae bacterium]